MMIIERSRSADYLAKDWALNKLTNSHWIYQLPPWNMWRPLLWKAISNCKRHRRLRRKNLRKKMGLWLWIRLRKRWRAPSSGLIIQLKAVAECTRRSSSSRKLRECIILSLLEKESRNSIQWTRRGSTLPLEGVRKSSYLCPLNKMRRRAARASNQCWGSKTQMCSTLKQRLSSWNLCKILASFLRTNLLRKYLISSHRRNCNRK